jgi:hypothetical protein
MHQHDPATRDTALVLLSRGMANREVAEHLGVPRGTVGWWLHQHRRAHGLVVDRRGSCARCRGEVPETTQYAYLLGLYLGDGHIVSGPRLRRLGITCCDTWPGLITATEDAIRAVLPDRRVTRYQKEGCTEVRCCSSHWPCLFPQHGPGRKHERRIVLEPWQQDIVGARPWEFLRGLFHSDGCRVTNWTVRTVAGRPKRYEYPRYLFTNKSDDIRDLCTAALTSVGVRWSVLARGGDPFVVSVARRACVARMDAHVGAKF